MGPIAPYARPETPAEAPNTIKVWKSWETAISLTLTMVQQPHHVWERSALLEFAIGHPTRINELLSNPGEGELLILHCGPIVLLQAGAVEMPYGWNGAQSFKREKMGVLVCHIPCQSIPCLTVLPALGNVYSAYS